MVFHSARHFHLPLSSRFTLNLPSSVPAIASLRFEFVKQRFASHHSICAMASGISYTQKPATDIFTPYQTDIDRRKCTRTVPMKVLALGLGRTGTASLRAALQELGFNDTYHMMNASVENPPDCLCLIIPDQLQAEEPNINILADRVPSSSLRTLRRIRSCTRAEGYRTTCVKISRSGINTSRMT